MKSRLNASHRGERACDAGGSVAGAPGLTLEALECGPKCRATAAPRADQGRRSADAGACSCSGKHAGILTTACVNEPVAGYSAADHPVQTRLIALIGALGGVDLTYTARGIDGCGIPVPACPWRR